MVKYKLVMSAPKNQFIHNLAKFFYLNNTMSIRIDTNGVIYIKEKQIEGFRVIESKGRMRLELLQC